MNVHDSERMAGLLEQAGFEATDDAAGRGRGGDQHVQRPRARRRQALHAPRRAARSWRPNTATIRSSQWPGCVAQQEGEAICAARPGCHRRRRRHAGDPPAADARRAGAAEAQSRPGSDPDQIPLGASTLIDLSAQDDVTWPLGVTRAARSGQGVRDDHRGLQRVLQLLRGAVHARARADAARRADILAEVREAADSGHREVQLLGQIVNHYAAPDDPSCDFSGPARGGPRRSTASSGSGSPARIRAT